MKRVIAAFYPLLLVILLFAACKETKKIDEDNPVFKTNPQLKLLTEKIMAEPAKATLYFERGKELYKLKEDTLAIKDFKMAVSLDSNNSSYYSAVGDLLFENKDISGSVEWLKKAIAKNPEDPRAHLKIAKLFLYTQDYPKAFDQLNIVLRKNVYNPEAYFLKGMIYKDMKDTAKAISSFQTALQVVPDYREASIQLGLIYTEKNDSVAIRYLDNAYKIDSQDVFPIFARAVYYQKNNEFARAKAEYRHCIIRDRHYIDAYFNLGYLLMQEDSVEKAFRQYDLVTKLQPNNPSAWYNLGVCNEMLKNVKEAVIDYRRALILDSSYSNPKKALNRIGVSLPKSN